MDTATADGADTKSVSCEPVVCETAQSAHPRHIQEKTQGPKPPDTAAQNRQGIGVVKNPAIGFKQMESAIESRRLDAQQIGGASRLEGDP